MATTAAEVCNIALSRIGQRQFIDDLSEDTAEARVCDAVYEDARDALLAAFPWQFATRRATLALLDSVERSGWTYCYALPEDFLAAQSLYAGQRFPVADARISYVLEHDATTSALILLTDEEDAELVYTSRITQPVLYPPLFVQTLAWKLAAELALGLTLKPQVAFAMEQRYLQELARAAAADSRQSQDDGNPDSEFIRVR